MEPPVGPTAGYLGSVVQAALSTHRNHKATQAANAQLAMTLMAQLVLAGGFIPVTDRPLFETLAWFTPGRWGFAATASTADLTHLVVGIANDPHWHRAASAWFFDTTMLGVLAVVFAGFA